MVRIVIPAAALALLLLAGVALAQSGDDPAAGPGTGYSLSWWTVGGGGSTAFGSGGSYSLSGTAGQPDAGLLEGRDYALAGGFSGGGVPAFVRRLYLPLVVRES